MVRRPNRGGKHNHRQSRTAQSGGNSGNNVGSGTGLGCVGYVLRRRLGIGSIVLGKHPDKHINDKTGNNSNKDAEPSVTAENTASNKVRQNSGN